MKLAGETPIERLKGIRTKAKIFVKRDDLNGLLISGSAARKLEYFIADATNKKCDTIVTCGQIQSNHCRITAAFANHFGFECHLMLHGRANKVHTGNLLISKLLGAKVKYITHAQYRENVKAMEIYGRRLRKKGRMPYIIPEGGSNEIGALGNLDCMKEMVPFIQQQRVEAVYCAVGSGGTYAGLLLGKKLLNMKIDLNGIIVRDTIDHIKEKIYKICSNAIKRFSFPVEITYTDMHLNDGYIGDGYAISYPEELRTIAHIAQSGIILEPVYTGKAFFGMLRDLKKHHYRRIIFIHTGGIFSIFGYPGDMTKVFRYR